MYSRVTADDAYIYSTNSSGVYVIDLYSENIIHNIDISGGANCVYSDGSHLFIGTNSGLYKGAINSLPHVYTTAVAPFITDNTVVNVNGSDGFVMCCTLSGVSILRKESEYITNCVINGPRKCFIAGQSFYYMSYDSGIYTVNRIDSNNSDWSVADVTYTTGSGFLDGVNRIYDMHVTVGTSNIINMNVLFMATNSGICVYDEGDGSFSYIKEVDGVTDGYVSVNTTPDAKIGYGKMYITASGTSARLVVYDLYSSMVIDFYSTTVAGRTGDYLQKDNIDSEYTYR